MIYTKEQFENDYGLYEDILYREFSSETQTGENKINGIICYRTRYYKGYKERILGVKLYINNGSTSITGFIPESEFRLFSTNIQTNVFDPIVISSMFSTVVSDSQKLQPYVFEYTEPYRALLEDTFKEAMVASYGTFDNIYITPVLLNNKYIAVKFLIRNASFVFGKARIISFFKEMESKLTQFPILYNIDKIQNRINDLVSVGYIPITEDVNKDNLLDKNNVDTQDSVIENSTSDSVENNEQKNDENIKKVINIMKEFVESDSDKSQEQVSNVKTISIDDKDTTNNEEENFSETPVYLDDDDDEWTFGGNQDSDINNSEDIVQDIINDKFSENPFDINNASVYDFFEYLEEKSEYSVDKLLTLLEEHEDIIKNMLETDREEFIKKYFDTIYNKDFKISDLNGSKYLTNYVKYTDLWIKLLGLSNNFRNLYKYFSSSDFSDLKSMYRDGYIGNDPDPINELKSYGRENLNKAIKQLKQNVKVNPNAPNDTFDLSNNDLIGFIESHRSAWDMGIGYKVDWRLILLYIIGGMMKFYSDGGVSNPEKEGQFSLKTLPNETFLERDGFLHIMDSIESTSNFNGYNFINLDAVYYWIPTSINTVEDVSQVFIYVKPEDYLRTVSELAIKLEIYRENALRDNRDEELIRQVEMYINYLRLLIIRLGVGLNTRLNIIKHLIEKYGPQFLKIIAITVIPYDFNSDSIKLYSNIEFTKNEIVTAIETNPSKPHLLIKLIEADILPHIDPVIQPLLYICRSDIIEYVGDRLMENIEEYKSLDILKLKEELKSHGYNLDSYNKIKSFLPALTSLISDKLRSRLR